jgi:hypothetical protein
MGKGDRLFEASKLQLLRLNGLSFTLFIPLSLTKLMRLSINYQERPVEIEQEGRHDRQKFLKTVVLTKF